MLIKRIDTVVDISAQVGKRLAMVQVAKLLQEYTCYDMDLTVSLSPYRY